MTLPRSKDVVLIAYAHQFDVELADGAEAEDILHVDVVHKPRIREWTDIFEDGRKTLEPYEPACGSKISARYGLQAVDRRVVNLRNVRKCQRVSCFGSGR